MKPKCYNVACKSRGCYWKGLRQNKDAPCPKCGGTDFWTTERKTREQRTAEYLARWAAR